MSYYWKVTVGHRPELQAQCDQQQTISPTWEATVCPQKYLVSLTFPADREWQDISIPGPAAPQNRRADNVINLLPERLASMAASFG